MPQADFESKKDIFSQLSGDYFYGIQYTAAKRYYYDKDLQTFETIVESFKSTFTKKSMAVRDATSLAEAGTYHLTYYMFEKAIRNQPPIIFNRPTLPAPSFQCNTAKRLPDKFVISQLFKHSAYEGTGQAIVHAYNPSL